MAILKKSSEKGYGKFVAFDNPRKKQREEMCVYVYVQEKQLSAVWEMETGRTDCCGNWEQHCDKMTNPRRTGSH